MNGRHSVRARQSKTAANRPVVEEERGGLHPEKVKAPEGLQPLWCLSTTRDARLRTVFGQFIRTSLQWARLHNELQNLLPPPQENYFTAPASETCAYNCTRRHLPLVHFLPFKK
ncbi:hypothetical protein AVEN_251470-1 [Araneus ventricosus]|uniref:Uncharacterized protein n=1 Tax=Araneus ventricosus TaxID=182803 RepID=A0A4Y2PQI9_ARAVE|nr:hypothetical protein AVEN_251470-1 [Araneus ventricosus]